MSKRSSVITKPVKIQWKISKIPFFYKTPIKDPLFIQYL